MAEAQAMTDGVPQVEILLNGINIVATTIDPLPAKPMAYRIINGEKMIFGIRDEKGTVHKMAFPPGGEEAWQVLIDTERLLVTEVIGTALEEGEQPGPDYVAPQIVRDDYIFPETA